MTKFAALFLGVLASAQVIVLVRGTGEAGGPPEFVSAANGEAQSAATSVASGTMNVAAGNFLFAFHRSQNTCSIGSAAAIPSDTAGNDWYPIAGSGATITKIIIVNGGSGYVTSGLGVSITGGGGSGAAANASQTGGVIDVVTITNGGSGFTSAPAVAITGGDPGTGAIVRVQTMSVNNPGPPTCSSAWYAYNVHGHASNAVTVTLNSQIFHGVSVQQWSGIKTSAPVVNARASGVSASGGTITSDEFTTTAGKTVGIFGLANESLTNSWTPGSGYTIPSGATNTSGYTTSQYQLFTSTQSGVTAGAANTSGAAKTILGALFEAASQ